MSKFYYATIDSINGLLSYEAESQEEVRQALINELERGLLEIDIKSGYSAADENEYIELLSKEAKRLEGLIHQYKEQKNLALGLVNLQQDDDFLNTFFYAPSVHYLKKLIAHTKNMSIEEYDDRYGWGDLK